MPLHLTSLVLIVIVAVLIIKDLFLVGPVMVSAT